MDLLVLAHGNRVPRVTLIAGPFDLVILSGVLRAALDVAAVHPFTLVDPETVDVGGLHECF